jgi:hypothetical protein
MDGVIQQVNFYQPGLKKQKLVFSASAMLIVIGILSVLLLVTSLFSYKQNHDHQKLVQEKQYQKDLFKEKLEEARGKLKPREKSQLLLKQIRDKRQAYTEIKKVKNMLDSVLIQSDSLYSGYFEALARSHVPGLWLTQIKVDNAGEAMLLSGNAMSGEKIPGLLLKLNGQKAFENSSFETVQIQEDEQTNLLAFTLETRTEEADSE